MKHVKNTFVAMAATLILIALPMAAKASLLIEPHIGYSVYGNADYQTSDISFNGPQYGARLGGQFLGLMGGLDYTHATFTLKTKTTAFGSGEDKQKGDSLGVFAGYNFPILLRAWATYYFSVKSTQTEDGFVGSKGDWNKGKGFGLGIGFTPLPLISINLEYKSSSFDKSESGAIDPKFKAKEIVLGVSLPITLL